MGSNFPRKNISEIFVKNQREKPRRSLHGESDTRKQRYIIYELPSVFLSWRLDVLWERQQQKKKGKLSAIAS